MTKVLFLLAALVLLLGACSTGNQIAQLKDYNDDVYYSEVSATEIAAIAKSKPQVAPIDQNNMYQDQFRPNIYNNYNYSGGIYYHTTPWRSYGNYGYNRPFDPWSDYYGYNSYYGYNNYYSYNNWYNPGMSIYIGINSSWINTNYFYRNLYGYPYLGSLYGGPVTYNTNYPGYNYGRYAGGYYNYNDPDYRARPSRGSENIGGSANGIGTIRTNGQGIMMTTPSRGEIYERNNPSSGSTTKQPPATATTGREARPSRTQSTTTTVPVERQPVNVPTTRIPSQTESISQSPSSSGNSGGGSSSSSSSDDASRARPARAGN